MHCCRYGGHWRLTNRREFVRAPALLFTVRDMSIAVTTVRTRARKITRRDNETEFPNAELDALILEACIEISERLLCIKTSTTGTLAGDGTSLAAPSDMVDAESAIEEFYLDSVVLDPLTFAEWRAGHMRGYAYREKVKTIYIAPTSDNDRSYTLYYSKVHGALSTNLEFDDDLKMAVIWLTCKRIYEDYELSDPNQAIKAEREYEREIAINGPSEPVISTMRTTRE